MEEILKNHEKKQAIKSNKLQLDVSLLKKEKSELSAQLNHLQHYLFLIWRQLLLFL